MKREIQLAKQIRAGIKDALRFSDRPALVEATLKLIKGASDDLVFLLAPTVTYGIQWRWRGDKEMEWCNFPSKLKMSKSEAEKFIKDYKAFNSPLIFRTRRI